MEFIYDGNGLCGVKCNNENYLYRKNAQGDITHILDNAGMVVAKYVYDAWGNHAILDANGNDLASGVGVLNPFRYRSYYYDEETDLYYLQTRYYDPELGRFLSQDDVSYLAPDSINGLNLYAYCSNNPVMNVDPTGTDDWDIFWNVLLGSLAVIVVTGLVVVTAGLAAVAIGAASSVVSSVMIGAAVGGLVSGGLELAGQLISSGGQSIDLNALAIESFTGAVFGALTGGYHSVSSNAAKIGFRVGKVGINTLNTVLHGINNGDDGLTILKDSIFKLFTQIVVQYSGYKLSSELGKVYNVFAMNPPAPSFKLSNMLLLVSVLLMKGIKRQIWE